MILFDNGTRNAATQAPDEHLIVSFACRCVNDDMMVMTRILLDNGTRNATTQVTGDHCLHTSRPLFASFVCLSLKVMHFVMEQNQLITSW